MVIPNDSTGYANYATLRGPLALAQNTLLGLTPTPAFALHPSMPEMQALYNSGNMALLTNVGTLLQPTTKTQYQANQVTNPTNLFSHPDQQESGRTRRKAEPQLRDGRAASQTRSTRNTTPTLWCR